VVVALAAAQGQAEPHRADGSHTIRQHASFVVLRLCPAFLVDNSKRLKHEALFALRVVGQQVAGQLLDVN